MTLIKVIKKDQILKLKKVNGKKNKWLKKYK